MKWVIQEGLYNQFGFESLVLSLNQLNLDYEVVKVIPFSDTIIPDLEILDKKAIVFGAGTLINVAKLKGWIPGSFSKDNFNCTYLRDVCGDLWLNNDAYFSQIGDLNFSGHKFVRPALDNKYFSGAVMSLSDFNENMDKEQVVVVAEPKQIINEYRFFIVDGVISSATMYKPYRSYFIDAGAVRFAEDALKVCKPDLAYALDICLTSKGEYKIVEVNSINGSGFYSAEVKKIIYDINSMLNKYF